MPKAVAIALGLPLGMCAALAVLAAPLPYGPVAFLGLLVFAGFLAWSGEPVSVAAPDAEAARPETKPLPEPPKPQDQLWAPIPGGSFSMGSDAHDSERPIHTVHLSPFQLMRVPVTRRQYQTIMGEDPGWPEGEADDRPVNHVSWLDAVALCNRWSEAEGLKPCYRIDGDEVAWEAEADGYRLPTEAEWEYACRAGSTTRWCFGDDEAELAEYAWFSQNSAGKPQPVATRQPNAWGLYDMHGNVWEWCWDCYGSYAVADQPDPTGPADGAYRVLRGGSFLVVPGNLRSAYRVWFRPEYRDWSFGFRCARGPRRLSADRGNPAHDWQDSSASAGNLVLPA